MVQVNNNTPIVLRVKFKKLGRLQYISHLDLVRTMMKIIVRAGLPLKYTEGFNPKPKLTFAAPLSIGVESLAEFMDIRLTEKMDTGEALSRLNANMTDEMQALEAYYPENKLTDLKWLGYDISICSTTLSEELARAAEELFASDSLPVLKKTKSGEAVVDIKPLIHSASVAYSDFRLALRCILSADSSSFLNPEYVVKLLRERCGILTSPDLLSEHYSILRTDAYRADMSEFK
ncbi:MAG: DUF2344 domain-containing protein [Ruminococcaceae bacterium]|nr:DUF2344 domain-containing protein [Oscillospiraceae bacterium]